jgi:hypothetical protein
MPLNLPPVNKSKNEEVQSPKPLYKEGEFDTLLKSGEVVFGTPGASLTWGINGVKGLSSVIGINGEEQTAKALKEYAEKNKGVYIFHSLMWPNSSGDTDHVLVYKNMIIVIDSKRWKSVRKYGISSNGFVLRGRTPFPEGKVRMLYALNRWREALKSVKVFGVVCIAQEKVFVTRDQNWYRAPYRLVEIEKLHEQLDFLIKKEDAAAGDNYALLKFLSKRVIKARNLRAELISEEALKHGR